jgi:hypothetical protein
MEKSVDNYFLKLEPAKRELALFLHRFFKSYDGVNSSIKYGIPFYTRNKWICYINCPKTGGIDITFLRANKFEKTIHLLETRGRKMVGSLVYDENDENLDLENLKFVMNEALAIDDKS